MNEGDNNICYCRRCDGVVHVIEQGDTLYKLSRQYMVKIEDILYKNPFINMYNLQVGEKICIPVMMGRPFFSEEEEL